MRVSALFFGIICICGSLGSTASNPRDLSFIRRWAIVLNPDPSEPTLADQLAAFKPEAVIVDPDHHPDLSKLSPKTIRLAYLSIGEAETYRPYWTKISSASFLVESNKEWEGNIRVDFRDAEWQNILLEEEIPRRIKAGYQGIMLDTPDAIAYLEKTSPERFKGMSEALKKWLQEVRRRYPDLIIAANGSESLVLAADTADVYVTEGLFATWDPAAQNYRASKADELNWKMVQLDKALQARRLPVWNVEYAAPAQTSLARWARRQSRKKNFLPFVSTRELNRMHNDLNR